MTDIAHDDRTLDRVLPPAHTCHQGPLCQGWEHCEDPICDEVGYCPDSGREGCDHGSCLDLVHEHCDGCQYEAFPGGVDELTHLTRDHGWTRVPGASPSDVRAMHRIAHDQEAAVLYERTRYGCPLVDHGRSPVHDMRHEFLGHNHEVSVPAAVGSAALARLGASSYGYRSGWIDREGRFGPAGQRWLLYTRRENTDGSLSAPVAF